MNDIQKELNSDYHDLSYIRGTLIWACRDYSALLIELHHSSSSCSDLINSLYISTIDYESINKKKNMYLKDINIVNESFHDQNFKNRQYHRESFSNRSNDKSTFDIRTRDKFLVPSSKKCFVCDKINYWWINHSKKKARWIGKTLHNQEFDLQSTFRV